MSKNNYSPPKKVPTVSSEDITLLNSDNPRSVSNQIPYQDEDLDGFSDEEEDSVINFPDRVEEGSWVITEYKM